MDDATTPFSATRTHTVTGPRADVFTPASERASKRASAHTLNTQKTTELKFIHFASSAIRESAHVSERFCVAANVSYRLVFFGAFGADVTVVAVRHRQNGCASPAFIHFFPRCADGCEVGTALPAIVESSAVVCMRN